MNYQLLNKIVQSSVKISLHSIVFFNVKISLHLFGGVLVRVINHIREIREQKGITQVKMAEDLQVTRQTINAIEKHKYNPSLELALKLVKYFNVPIEELFELEEDDA